MLEIREHQKVFFFYIFKNIHTRFSYECVCVWDMEFFSRTFTRCGGGLLVSLLQQHAAPDLPKQLTTFANTNATMLTKGIGYSHLIHSIVDGNVCYFSDITFHCTDDGILEYREPNPRTLASVRIHFYYSKHDGEKFAIYDIIPEKLLTERTIGCLVKTEYLVNNHKLRNREEYVKQKLAIIKEKQGDDQARRWCVYYNAIWDLHVSVESVAGVSTTISQGTNQLRRGYDFLRQQFSEQ